MIQSEKLEQLKDRFETAKELIVKAVNEKRPIWIRHHYDCDGYCGGVILEKAILKLLYDFHSRESDVFYFFKRLPSRTPFYSQEDATKDISIFLGDAHRFNRKSPLIIVVDNGSSDEDTLALKKLKAYDVQTIVIDHHPFSEENDNYIDVHINSMFVNDGGISAGMLGAELANMLVEGLDDVELFAALAGVGDRSDNDEHHLYIKLAEEKGFDKNKLLDVAELIDFEAGNLGYMEARYFVQDILFGNRDVQEKFIKIIRQEVLKKKEMMLKSVKANIEIINLDNFVIAMLNIDSNFHHEYKSFRIAAGLGLELVEKKTSKSAVMLGYGKEMITFRISKQLDFDMNKIKDFLKDKFPHALIGGGGHAKAGTISFSSGLSDKILEEVKQYLKRGKND